MISVVTERVQEFSPANVKQPTIVKMTQTPATAYIPAKTICALSRNPALSCAQPPMDVSNSRAIQSAVSAKKPTKIAMTTSHAPLIPANKVHAFTKSTTLRVLILTNVPQMCVPQPAARIHLPQHYFATTVIPALSATSALTIRAKVKKNRAMTAMFARLIRATTVRVPIRRRQEFAAITVTVQPTITAKAVFVSVPMCRHVYAPPTMTAHRSTMTKIVAMERSFASKPSVYLMLKKWSALQPEHPVHLPHAMRTRVCAKSIPSTNKIPARPSIPVF